MNMALEERAYIDGFLKVAQAYTQPGVSRGRSYDIDSPVQRPPVQPVQQPSKPSFWQRLKMKFMPTTRGSAQPVQQQQRQPKQPVQRNGYMHGPQKPGVSRGRSYDFQSTPPTPRRYAPTLREGDTYDF